MADNQFCGFEVFENRVKLEGALISKSGLHVGSGRALDPEASDLPVVKDFSGRPFIPGSSFKGVLRSNLESFLRSLKPKQGVKLVCNPIADGERCVSSEKKKDIFQKATRGEIADPEKEIWKQSCWLCHLFGSPWLASKVKIADMPINGNWRSQMLGVRQGVAIDRESETVGEGPYDFEVVPPETEFKMSIVVENPEPYELGLLMLGFQMFDQGFALLGGNTSRGLGRVEIKLEDILEITPQQILESLNPELEEGAPSEEEQPKITLPEHFQQLVACLKEAAQLNHNGLVASLQTRGWTKQKIREAGFKNFKDLFEKALKDGVIMEKNGFYFLKGKEEMPEEAPKKVDIEQKQRAWLSALARKLKEAVEEESNV
ncbi:MAG: CRISPR-associated RAMP protein [Aquificota bacterium]|nr:MAG: CRISPR-associated RAMP protein [Aquificota bacterium]